MAATRRPHTKSRLGCSQCKARKVKCDQAAPTCSNCVRRNEHCSLTEVNLHLAQHVHYFPPQTLVPKSTKGEGKEQHTCPYTTLDIELTHFYATQTWNTILTRPHAAAPFKNELFELGLQQPILLDALLVTAAMHKLANTPNCPRRADYCAFIINKGTGVLPHVIEKLKAPNEDNSIFLMASSIMLTVWAFAHPRLPQEANLFATPEFAANAPSPFDTNMQTPRLDALFKVLSISHGTRTIVSGMHEWIAKAGFSAVYEPVPFATLPPTPPSIIVALHRLEDHARAHADAIGNTEIFAEYLSQITRLGEMFRISQAPEWYDRIVGFAVRLEHPVINLLRHGDPCALTILAFWTACLWPEDGKWWVHGWAKTLFDEISQVLHEDWQEHLQVPRSLFS